jgi:hypothetical protein
VWLGGGGGGGAESRAAVSVGSRTRCPSRTSGVKDIGGRGTRQRGLGSPVPGSGLHLPLGGSCPVADPVEGGREEDLPVGARPLELLPGWQPVAPGLQPQGPRVPVCKPKG